jgi:MFS family permease
VADDAVKVAPPPEDEPFQTTRIGTFHSLQFRDFRYLWQGQIGASASQWMEQIARPLLILELTNSAFLVGLIAATRMVPMLLMGLWAGVLADRMDKKRILQVCQSITFTTHAATAALILMGTIEPWMVFVGAFVTGSAQAFNQPARSSLVPRLVPRDSMANAIALNSAAFNIMRTGGPSIAGLVLFATDFGELYAMQALVYIWVIWSTSHIQVRTNPERRERPSMLTDLFEGFGVVKKDRIILYIMLLSLALFVFGMPFQSVFVPLIAVDSLEMSRSVAGLLVSLVGAGALIGSLVVATIGDSVRRRGLLMIGMIIAFCLALLVFARAESLFLIAPALMTCGAMQVSFMALNNAFVLGRTAPELHGRVMSLFSLDRGLVPLGATLGGFLAATLGPQDGLMVMALICLVLTLIVALFVPSLRKMA